MPSRTAAGENLWLEQTPSQVALRDYGVGTLIEERVYAIPEPATPFCFYDTNLPDWKVFWRSKDQHEYVIGIGSVLSLSSLQEVSRLQVDHKARFFGGIPFFEENKQPAESWQDFTAPVFFLPEIEWNVAPAGAQLTLRSIRGGFEATLTKFRQILAQARKGLPRNFPIVCHSRNTPELGGWKTLVAKAKQAINDKFLQKVVLSNCKLLEFAEAPSLGLLLSRLSDLPESSYLFALQAPSGAAFLGRSPERLLSWNGNQFEVDAIAGTRKRGQSDASDGAEAEELASSHKEKQEHRVVADYVRHLLTPLADELALQEAERLLKLANAQHMISRFKGILKPGVEPMDVLMSLHPTPAVGGFPLQPALEFLLAFEPFARGFFAGPIGWFGKATGDFAIGIRSALLRGKQLAVFAGAGLVEFSDADAEWGETRVKMKNFLDLFEVPHEPPRV